MKFTSPTDGVLSFKKMYKTIMNFVREKPGYNYNLIVGTDSQPAINEAVFVTAVVIYREGNGGRYFYHKEKTVLKVGMKQRIYYEVSRSLETASKLTAKLAEEEYLDENLNVQIHVDVGNKGPTNNIIKEVVGMVVGSGYEAMIKPESYAASSVADKHTK
ncbi:MAG: ribonuclease H-like YkuK family protein [Bacillota bacterium]